MPEKLEKVYRTAREIEPFSPWGKKKVIPAGTLILEARFKPGVVDILLEYCGVRYPFFALPHEAVEEAPLP